MIHLDPTAYNAVVIGSGFGGSVSAYRLAKAGHEVLVLERGRPWPPGSFPRSPRGTGGIFWDPPERYGMFDIWSFSGINAVAASGLGGGSLIYANVLLRKPPETFRNEDGSPWPVSADELGPDYEAVEDVLEPVPYPVEHQHDTPKTLAMQRAAAAVGREWEASPLAVTFAAPGREAAIGDPLPRDRHNLFGLARSTCRLCGECDIGCNYGSKNTLDHTYLSRARGCGATIRALCQVTTIAPRDGGYAVTYKQHMGGRDGISEELLGDPEHERVTVHTRRVILAAGAMGTAHLLLRNRANLPRLGGRLGDGFSSNGDLLTFAWDTDQTLDMSRGPVITGTVRWDEESPGGRMLQVQDAGVPAMAEWLFETPAVPATLLALRPTLARWLMRKLAGDRDTQISGELAGLIGKAKLSSGTLPLLGMGRDIPGGRFYLDGEDLDLSWREEESRRFFDDLTNASRSLARALGGRFKEVPIAHYITVHALGGCAMAKEPHAGVVNEWGESFGHPGLHIADGSVMPGPVGPNPSLTIAALANRFAGHLTGERR